MAKMASRSLERAIIWPPSGAESIIDTFDYAQLAPVKAADPDIKDYQTAITGLKQQWVEWEPGIRVMCDVSCGRNRPILLEAWCRPAFDIRSPWFIPSICLNDQEAGWGQVCLAWYVQGHDSFG